MRGAGERRRTELGAALALAMLLIAAVFLAYVLAFAAQTDGGHGALRVALWLGLFLIAYGVMRSRHPRLGRWLVVLVPWVAIWVAWQVDAPHSSLQVLYFLFLPISLAALLLPMGTATAFVGVNLAVAVAALFLTEWSSLAPVVERIRMVLFLLAVSLVVLVGGGFLERSLVAQEDALDRMRASDAERMQLLHIIAHDLAAPLSPILLRLDLLQLAHRDDRNLEVIQRNMDHMVRLITDLKDLARVEGGGLRLEKRHIDLAALVEQATDGFLATASDREVALRADVRGPLPVFGDPDRLNQVLYNLLTNAIKFSPAGGTVTAGAWREDGHVRVRVEDQGRGLTQEEMGQLFQPFAQVHDRKEVEEKGTGLGLYISKGIVEGHGGRIWVESEGHGKGATFGFDLPLLDPVSADTGPSVTSPAGRAPARLVTWRRSVERNR